MRHPAALKHTQVFGLYEEDLASKGSRVRLAVEILNVKIRLP